jgi:hypothetical protein
MESIQDHNPSTNPVFGQSGWLVYGALNLAVLVAIIAGASVGGGSLAELPYVMLMFAICASPLLFIARFNDAFALLGVVMAVNFISFALGDAVAMLSPPKVVRSGDSLMEAGEVVLVAGMLMQLLGGHAGIRLRLALGRSGNPKDWPRSLLIPLGLMLWTGSCAATLYHSLVVQPENTGQAVLSGFAKLGVWKTSVLILFENYAGPLGLVVLSYWWSKWGKRGGNALMLAIIFAQFAVGWVVDTKETAVNAPVVMLLTRFVVTGRVPVRWLICSFLGIMLVFPVLTAKRVIMTEGLGLSRVEALAHMGELIERAIEERDLVRTSNKYDQKAGTFLGRLTDKSAVETFVDHIGKDKPYKLGSTLQPMLYVFIPRIIWSNKPGENAALLFNREFNISADRDTYISPTHIGELYWNFGFIGVAVGMALIGLLLGYVFARFDPSRRTSITGVLVLIVTLYELAVRRGGQIEAEYVVWLRTMALLGLLHLAFARAAASSAAPADASTVLPLADGGMGHSVRFPNLLR